MRPNWYMTTRYRKLSYDLTHERKVQRVYSRPLSVTVLPVVKDVWNENRIGLPNDIIYISVKKL